MSRLRLLPVLCALGLVMSLLTISGCDRGLRSKSETVIMLPGDVPLVMVHIPAGTYMRGCYPGEHDSEKSGLPHLDPPQSMGRAQLAGQNERSETPQHEVTLTQDFFLGKYPVTQAQYEAVMGTNPSHFSDHPDNPVDSVSWDDAQAFITALNAHVVDTGQGSATFRLPTEAEWEYACRAGTTTRFYWGDDPDYTQIAKYAWYGHSSYHSTHPVGQKLPNPWGLYDMSGNVFEWCQDWYGDYPEGPVTDPTGPASGSGHIMRGGSWGTGAAGSCRSAYRRGRWSSSPIHVGFRLARS